MTQPSGTPVPGVREWTFPASAGQERIWLAQRLDPGSPVFTLPGSVRVRAATAADVVGRWPPSSPGTSPCGPRSDWRPASWCRPCGPRCPSTPT